LARGLHSTKTGTSLFCVTSGMGWGWGRGGLKTHKTIKQYTTYAKQTRYY